MRALVVIPARYGSSRFPGKPLAPVRGRSVIERVWRIARAAHGVDGVLVATDDARIADHVAAFGGTAVMTPAECANGTERVHAALASHASSPRVVVNLQGDAILTPPWVIEALVAVMLGDETVELATPAVRMTREQYDAFAQSRRRGATTGTTVTFDRRGDALYFSKALIPNVREPGDAPWAFRHIGLYAYTPAALARYIALPAGALEQAERLEQLRALEHGMAIRVVEVDYRGRTHGSIDSPEDVGIAEAIIEREGELTQ